MLSPLLAPAHEHVLKQIFCRLRPLTATHTADESRHVLVVLEPGFYNRVEVGPRGACAQHGAHGMWLQRGGGQLAQHGGKRLAPFQKLRLPLRAANRLRDLQQSGRWRRSGREP